ncbi:MAG: sulfatase [Phycisphaerae bacterium]|nr:sulfatase [Phycisphaerae bacterium]
MNRRTFIKSVSALALAGFSGCQKLPKQSQIKQPNILFIYADDLGYSSLSCYGHRYYESPNIDKLACEGMRFTDAYSCGPVCAPSRACLVSGQYVTRHGIYRVNQVDEKYRQYRKMEPPTNITDLPLGIKTFGDVMQKVGYRTGYCGKWHLSHAKEITDWHPSRRGFDFAVQSLSPSGDKRYFYPNFSSIPKVDVADGTYLTDFINGQALDFIDKNKDKPFFMYLPHFNVHGPHEAKEKTIAKYEAKAKTTEYDDPTYGAMIEHLDNAVGQLMDKLDEHNLAENTIVIFTSDNGGIEKFSNAPLRGGKGCLYEGGIRIPMVVRWPGMVKAGSVCDEPVIGVDFMPTFIDIAKAEAPEGQVLDGVSILPLLKGAGKVELERDALYWHYPTYMKFSAQKKKYAVTPCSAIRMGDFKLILMHESQKVELYNLKEDISESRNLAKLMPGKVDELELKLKLWLKETGAMMPIRK